MIRDDAINKFIASFDFQAIENETDITLAHNRRTIRKVHNFHFAERIRTTQRIGSQLLLFR